MINGAHAIVYSTNSEADRNFLKDVLGLPHVDVGEGWLIFGLPPAEVAVHPSENNGTHELYLMCDDVAALVAEMEGRGLGCSPVEDQGWGLLTHLTLPGGGKLGIYQPRHARPPMVGAPAAAAAKKARASKTTKKAVKAVAKVAKKAAKPSKKAVKAVKKAAKADKKAQKKAKGKKR